MFTLFFDTDNEAFQGDVEAECARILRVVAARLEKGETWQSVVRDVNGNTVGKWELDHTEEEEEEEVERLFPVGTRVRLTEDVDRFDDGIARAGETGTVVQSDDDGLSVKLDREHTWLAEWDNCLGWHPDETPELEALDDNPFHPESPEGRAWESDPEFRRQVEG